MTLTLPPALRAQVQGCGRRFVIVGATGWIGLTALALLAEALGEEAPHRLACFGSSAREIRLPEGRGFVQQPLEELGGLERAPTVLLHLAFLTKDKVAGMAADEYVAGNRRISRIVAEALGPIGADRLFVASSGAAAFADDTRAAADLRLYGALKRDDEAAFADWANRDPAARRAAICRIYSVSGPFINKHAVYALADMILRGLRGQTVAATAPREVWRGFVAVREVVALVLAMLLAEDGPAVRQFDSGGFALELGEVAEAVAQHFGASAQPRTITESPANVYVGDHGKWLSLLEEFSLSHIPLEQQISETVEWLAELERADTCV